MGDRLTFGSDVPCGRCHMTGKVKAPALTKADKAARRYENLRRAGRGEPVLPRPPATTECPLCGGRGTLPSRLADNPRTEYDADSGTEWPRSGVDVQ